LRARTTTRLPIARFPHSARFAHSARFPPTAPRSRPPPKDAGQTVDPILFSQIRQRIVQRHNASTVEVDEDLVNRSIFQITSALKNKDLSLARRSWEELERVKCLHFIGPQLLEEIAKLAMTHSPTDSLLSRWSPDGQEFVESVVLAAASRRSLSPLQNCMLKYLQREDANAALKLYAKFTQLHTESTASDVEPLEEEVVVLKPKSETSPSDLFLVVVAAYAHLDAFEDAARAYLGMEQQMDRHSYHPMSRRLPLKTKAKFLYFVQRLDVVRSVSRPLTLSKHIDNLSKHPQSNRAALQELYESVMDTVLEPDACVAPDDERRTPTKIVGMSELIWASFLTAFLRRSENEMAAKVWKHMTQLGVKPGILTWNLVIAVYEDRRSVREALGAWDAMVAQGVQPDGATFRSVISCLFSARQSDDAVRWFKAFVEKTQSRCSQAQTIAIYNAMLHGFLQEKKNEAKAMELFRLMLAEGPEPDLVSYNTLMGYHGRWGDLKAMAAVIQEMSAKQVAGDVFTYSTILSALLKVGRTDAPQMVIGIMRRQGVKANVAIYTAIIDAQMREQTVASLQIAMKMLDGMENDPDTAPNHITYTTILAGLYRGTWLTPEQIQHQKDDIVARMKRRKIVLEPGGYNILINACLRWPDSQGLEEALWFYRDMTRRRVPLDTSTWYILLAGSLARGEWKLAREIAEDMFASNIQPTNSILRLVDQIRERGIHR
ncbi:unnamed protein product, partial [Mycena citricolor]